MSRVDSVGKALNLGVVILETHGAVSCDGTSIDVAKWTNRSNWGL